MSIELIKELSNPEKSTAELAIITQGWIDRGIESSELAEIASYIRSEHLTTYSPGYAVLDCCGTGGDSSGSYNISTTVAFMLAAYGLKVAKHGGRSTTSQSGSIDFLEAAKLPTHTDIEAASKALDMHGLAFIASPALHGLLGCWKAACKEYNYPGMTGLIGTLTNPIDLTHQIIGVPRYDWGELMIESLRELGRPSAMVVFGEPQLDEASICGITHVWHLQGGAVQSFIIDPEQYGIEEYTLSDIKGGTPDYNVEIFQQILSGTAPRAITEAIKLNMALALLLIGEVESISNGLSSAAELLNSGKPREFYQQIISQG